MNPDASPTVVKEKSEENLSDIELRPKSPVTDLQKRKELLFCETDVWELSGLSLAVIKRKFVSIDVAGYHNFEVRVTTIDLSEDAEKPTLLLCNNYMLAGCL